MSTQDTHVALRQLFAELTNGPAQRGGAYILNSGDIGLLRSLETLSADDASRSTNDGATIAAHAQHLRYGLSLMNRWATDGGNPFADAKWDAAWEVSAVSGSQWEEIQAGLRAEAARWLDTLGVARDVSLPEVMGMIGSVAHLAYHLGAIRQIARSARGPKEGTFP